MIFHPVRKVVQIHLRQFIRIPRELQLSGTPGLKNPLNRDSPWIPPSRTSQRPYHYLADICFLCSQQLYGIIEDKFSPQTILNCLSPFASVFSSLQRHYKFMMVLTCCKNANGYTIFIKLLFSLLAWHNDYSSFVSSLQCSTERHFVIFLWTEVK